VNTIRFAKRCIWASTGDTVSTSAGTDNVIALRAVSGRQVENTVRDARGRRFGRRVCVRVCMRRSERDWVCAGDLGGMVVSGMVERDIRRGKEGNFAFASIG
jgi:hypothetical protein